MAELTTQFIIHVNTISYTDNIFCISCIYSTCNIIILYSMCNMYTYSIYITTLNRIQNDFSINALIISERKGSPIKILTSAVVQEHQESLQAHWPDCWAQPLRTWNDVTGLPHINTHTLSCVPPHTPTTFHLCTSTPFLGTNIFFLLLFFWTIVNPQ